MMGDMPGGSLSGVGDTVQSFFISPNEPTAGVTGVVLKQNGPWTVGELANYIWSFAGDSGRLDVNAT